MKSTRLWVLAALPFALTACGGGDGDAAEGGTDTTTVAPSTETSSTTTPPAATDTGMSGAQAMGGAVTMNAVGNSGVTGQAQFMDHGQGQTMVTVNLTGQGSSTHSGHIHQGTCDAPGSVVAPLQDITLANGTGTSTTTVPAPLATVMNGQHIVAYHTSSGENPGAPVVCAQIPAQQAGGTTTPAM
ncbi:MAG TPA: hypothetical protein VGX50_06565 [Longimicrobium sp.]|jgi:hypothetical protein|nr:hypothetical protein [Longimicrobium sp.]